MIDVELLHYSLADEICAVELSREVVLSRMLLALVLGNENFVFCVEAASAVYVLTPSPVQLAN